LLYAVSSSAEILLIKALNYNYQVNLPMLVVLCLNCYFPLQACHMFAMGSRPLGWKPELKRAYLGLGLIQALVTTSRSYAINNLPGPVYVIVSNLSIVWNFMLSKLFLDNQFTHYHYVAIACTIGAAIAASRYRSRDESDFHTFSAPRWTWGIVSCVTYSFLTAATSVLASKVLKRAGANKKSRVCVSELSFANSFIPAIVSLPIVLLLKLGPVWEETWDNVEANHQQVGVVAIFVSLALSKMIDRVSKFELINIQSAFYYQVLNAMISGGQAILAILVFHDKLTFEVFFALVLLALALGFTIAGDRAVEARAELQLHGDMSRRLSEPDAYEANGDVELSQTGTDSGLDSGSSVGLGSSSKGGETYI
jgi:drug/metabolite transporter (DMT)-like permease